MANGHYMADMVVGMETVIFIQVAINRAVAAAIQTIMAISIQVQVALVPISIQAQVALVPIS